MAVYARDKVDRWSGQTTGVSGKVQQLAPQELVLITQRKSLVHFLNLVRGAHPHNPQRQQYTCQKQLEKDYQTDRVTAAGNGWQAVTKAVMSESSGLTGGYLLPQDYSDALLEVIAEESFIYPRATVIPMFSADLQAPRLDVETAPTAAGICPFFGGVNFLWGLEDAAVETEPTFRMGSFHAWDLLGYCTVSNQWLQDAGAIQPTTESPRPAASPLLMAEHYLLRMFGRASALTAEWAFLNGAGAAQQMPLGIVRAPGTFAAARAGANLIAVADVANMAARLLPYSWMNAIWACSPTALAQIQQIASYSINQYHEVEQEPRVRRPRPCGVLSSLPLFVTDKLPTLGNRGDLVLFDPSLYIIAQRMEVVVDVSPDDLFRNNQTVYRIWLRLDGKPMTSGTITLQDTTTVVAPYVVLAV